MKTTESYEQLLERFTKRTNQVLVKRNNLTEKCPAWEELNMIAKYHDQIEVLSKYFKKKNDEQ